MVTGHHPIADHSSDLALATVAAETAGSILAEYWRERGSLEVSIKRAGDFVSDADLAAEQSLRTSLLGARPSDGWLGEETSPVDGFSRRWIVDPLDGTTNFLRGIAHWAVSVALEIDGEIVLGVVHDPIKAETFAAAKDYGATLNGHPLSLAQTASMASALFGTGIPFGPMPHIDDHTEDLTRVLPHCAGIRRLGAASLDLAYVAAGRLDGFWERRLQIWDIAAGLVLLREAGATVEGWHSDERPEESGTVIAAIPSLFADLAGRLRQRS